MNALPSLSGKGIFITGVGTGVGKTTVVAGLLRCLRRRGVNAAVMKPVQSGTEVDGSGRRFSRDLAFACQAADFRPEAEVLQYMCPYCLSLPSSPHLAAREENITVSLSEINAAFQALAARYDLVIVEGAGGAAVPLNERETMFDLMRTLKLPVAVVVSNVLGSINHAVLTLDGLRHNGCDILGVIMTGAASGTELPAVSRDNPAAIKSFGRTEILAELCHIADCRPDSEEFRAATEAAFAPVADLLKQALLKKSDGQEFVRRELEFDRDHLWHPYASILAPPPVYHVSAAAGVRLKMSSGDELIDGISSWWCAIHGYNHPALNAAAEAQLRKMSHVMFGGLTHHPAVALAEKLLKLVPALLQYVFFADSGSVAVEVALKMALQYWQAAGQGRKNRILTVRNGYHGDTFGAMAVCDLDNGMHRFFNGVLPENIFVEAPSCGYYEQWNPESFAAMRRAIATEHETVAAVIIEPVVQGAGGMRFYHPQYLRELRQCCDDYGILLIFDEIATGFGRTGTFFAAEHAAVSPDIMCVGKALTGGYMTMSATLASAAVARGIAANGRPLMHGPTFMANPLACAVAVAGLELLSMSPWRDNVKNIEQRFKAGFAGLECSPAVSEVRVLGAIGVVEMRHPIAVAEVQRELMKQGVWLRPFGRLLYAMPPYVISEPELDKVIAAMRHIVKLTETGQFRDPESNQFP